jgi:hypothetical protein
MAVCSGARRVTSVQRAGTPGIHIGLAIEAEFLSTLSDSGDVLWGPELASRDSDGDGFTNGDELGDPEGTGIADPDAIVSAPGDAADFPKIAFSGSPLDIDGDGAVDNADFDLFAPRFFDSRINDTPAETVDFDADGIVGINDLILLLQNLGRSSADTT